MNEWDVGNATPVKTNVLVVSDGVHCYNIFETPFIRLLVKTIGDSLCVVRIGHVGWGPGNGWVEIQIKTR